MKGWGLIMQVMCHFLHTSNHQRWICINTTRPIILENTQHFHKWLILCLVHQLILQSLIFPLKEFYIVLSVEGKGGINQLDELFKLFQGDFETWNLIHWWMDYYSQSPNLFWLTQDILSIPGCILCSYLSSWDWHSCYSRICCCCWAGFLRRSWHNLIETCKSLSWYHQSFNAGQKKASSCVHSVHSWIVLDTIS